MRTRLGRDEDRTQQQPSKPLELREPKTASGAREVRAPRRAQDDSGIPMDRWDSWRRFINAKASDETPACAAEKTLRVGRMQTRSRSPVRSAKGALPLSPKPRDDAKSTVSGPSNRGKIPRTASGRIDYWRDEDSLVVMMPSLDFDEQEMKKVKGALHYEQRLLWNLLLLNRSDAELVFVSSKSVPDHVVDYYLSLDPRGPSIEDRRARARMLPIEDEAFLPLSTKIFLRPDFVEFTRETVESSPRRPSGLAVFSGSAVADRLSSKLALPLLEASADQMTWGSKSGSRIAFQAARVPHPVGVPRSMTGVLAQHGAHDDADLLDRRGYIATSTALATAIARAVDDGVRVAEWMVKLNEGFSGAGNAELDLSSVLARDFSGISDRGARVAAIAQAIEETFPSMIFAAGEEESWSSFKGKIEKLGVIAEQFIGGEKRSPSCQALIKEHGRVEILSTHEQRLGGARNQVYLGCEMPADAEYRETLYAHTAQVASFLASQGVRGHLAVDYLVSRPSAEPDAPWNMHALEVNLRMSGTTAPYMTLHLLTGGGTGVDGVYRTASGAARGYAASDNLSKPSYKGIRSDTLIRAIQGSEIHWNPETEEGVVLHLFGALEPHGKIGYTAIAETQEKAREFGQRLEAMLDALAISTSATALEASGADQPSSPKASYVGASVEPNEALDRARRAWGARGSARSSGQTWAPSGGANRNPRHR